MNSIVYITKIKALARKNPRPGAYIYRAASFSSSHAPIVLIVTVFMPSVEEKG